MKGTAFLIAIVMFFVTCSETFALTISSSSMDSSQKMFILTAKEKVPPIHLKKMVLNNPHRVVYDLENAVLANTKAQIETTNPAVKSVRIAQFSPNSVRIVFTGESSALDQIRINTVHNMIIFNMSKPADRYGTTVYAEKAPPQQDVDYYSYYEELNVIMSNNLSKSPSKYCPIDKSYSNVCKTPEISSTGAVWNSIETVRLQAQYNIFNIEASLNGVVLQGLGTASLASPFYLSNPSRLVIDLPNTAFRGGKAPSEIQISPKEKIRFGVQPDNTVRVTIESPEAQKYKAIVSPDLISVSIQKNNNLAYANFPYAHMTTMEKFEAKQEGKQTTVLKIKAKRPLAHSIKRNPEEIELALYNLNMGVKMVTDPKTQKTLKKGNDDFLKVVPMTKQFKTIDITPMGNNTGGSLWKIPIKRASIVSEQLSSDGSELTLIIADNIYKAKDIVIKSGATVMIDPGHGGTDVGATREGINEKDINLDVSKQLKTYLESKGVKVIMTRDTDVFIPLPERVSKANSAAPDVFVSVHVNSSQSSTPVGLETHWYRVESQKFAKIVHNNLSLGVDSPDRGIIQSQFYVINHTVMPAVLVEIGFISNPDERCDMIKPQRKYTTAKSIGNGILLYLAMEYENEAKVKVNGK